MRSSSTVKFYAPEVEVLEYRLYVHHRIALQTRTYGDRLSIIVEYFSTSISYNVAMRYCDNLSTPEFITLRGVTLRDAKIPGLYVQSRYLLVAISFMPVNFGLLVKVNVVSLFPR